MTVSNDLECLFRCQSHNNCVSVNYRQLGVQPTGLCELNDATGVEFPGHLRDMDDYDYVETL